ncbi:MAG TPA: GNAT family N-acetyltransferase [Clostridiaceae bacterium]|nr:GNAT family N-acetyltransferase [Clostridiaceae bacterium]
MKFRSYESKDCEEIIKLFQETVHTVNARDYGKDQLDVWATGREDLVKWDNSFKDHVTIVAEENGSIVGFGDMDREGYLDHLYVHKDHQRKGVAAKIVGALENEAEFHDIPAFTTFSSITAKPFFEKMGYRVMYKNTVIREGVELINYFMKKEKKNR